MGDCWFFSFVCVCVCVGVGGGGWGDGISDISIRLQIIPAKTFQKRVEFERQYKHRRSVCTSHALDL